MSGCPARQDWTSFLEERLPAPQQAALERHVQDCAACQLLLEELTGLESSVATLFPRNGHDTDPSHAPLLDDTYRDQLARLLQQPTVLPAGDGTAVGAPVSALPEVPGYDVLEELGRGGMGVVYKARQQELKRLVALKMVLGSARLDPDRLARFRREAEAVAQLQHPHIVQIHEIGTLEGHPYFALEYIAGGSLDQQLRGQPQPPREAAALVEKLAQAMQAAHARGIIHRDLKPANILLTLSRAPQARAPDSPAAAVDSPARASGARLNESIPKITDFGLAKQLDAEDGQTRTGEIVGTPSYMAPEQAAGQSKVIGPGTDLYALGAVLYEMLTGRPPFQGPTPMETVLQVLHNEPVPPSRLQPKLPPDLETICLKCLAKEPGRRYLSAEALAADLRRFLENRPILARPTGRLERTWRWCRRNPGLAGLAGLLLLAVVGLAVGFVLLWRSYDQLAQAQHQTQAALAAEGKRRQQARAALDAMTSKVIDDLLAGQQQLKDTDKAFLREGLARYREFATDTGNDPGSQAEVAHATLRVGDILRRLGELREAEQAYHEAIRQFSDLLHVTPQATAEWHSLAGAYHNLGGLLLKRNAWTDARAAFTQSHQLHRKLVADHPDRDEFTADLALSHNALAVILAQENHHEAAQASSREALKLLRALCQQQPTNLEYQRRCHVSLQSAAKLHIAQGDLPAARRLYEEADQISDGLVRKQPTFAHRQLHLEGLMTHAVLLSNLGQPRAAATKLDDANRLAERLVRDLPAVPELRESWGDVLMHRGNLHFMARELAPAVAGWQQAQQLYTRLVEDYPSVPRYHSQLASTVLHLGIAHMYRQEYDPARKEFEQAIGIFRKLAASDPGNLDYRHHLSLCCSNLGNLLHRQKEYAAARTAFAETAQLQRLAMTENPRDTRFPISLGGTCCNLGNVARDAGDLEAAVTWYGQAIALLDDVLRREPRLTEARGFLFNACMGRAGVLNRLRRYVAALADWERLSQLNGRPLEPVLRLPRALALAHAGNLEQAVAQAEQLAAMRDIPGAAHFDLARLWAVAAHKAGTSPQAATYATAAVQQLRQAQTLGFFRETPHRQRLQTEEDFAALRQREAFRKFVEELPAASPGSP